MELAKISGTELGLLLIPVLCVVYFVRTFIKMQNAMDRAEKKVVDSQIASIQAQMREVFGEKRPK